MDTVLIFTIPQISDERWLEMTMEQEKPSTGFMSPADYAVKHKVSYHTVLNWIQGNKVQYIKRQAGSLSWYLIPANAKRPHLKTGPKPKSRGQKD